MPETIMVRPGALEVRNGNATLATLGLGSCVCVGLLDPVAGVGGLTHCLLPDPPSGSDRDMPGRYTSTAVPRLLEMMLAAGGQAGRMRAWIAGGASMFPGLSLEGLGGIGERNSEAARRVLSEIGVPLAGEETGGNQGRSVRLHVAGGRFVVRSVMQPEVVL